MHFWFHALIMLLHQPSLIHSFEDKILRLLPNSRELSMSSAKTIADILAFAELIDPKSFIGNPFTSQPMYIAACAFLMESAAHTPSQPRSRNAAPPHHNSSGATHEGKESSDKTNEQQQSLLASAATQHYQRCYKSLQQLEIYWAGMRYILVALDQKSKGIWDPETYTEQEYEAARRHELIRHWRPNMSVVTASSPGTRLSEILRSPRVNTGSPSIDTSQAFGFSLTGTTNSSSSNLTFMYQNMNDDQPNQQPTPLGAGNMIYDPIRQTLPKSTPDHPSTFSPNKYQSHPQNAHRSSGNMDPPALTYTHTASDPACKSDAGIPSDRQALPFSEVAVSQQHAFDAERIQMTSPSSQQNHFFNSSQQNINMFNQPLNHSLTVAGVGDMTMESQEVDMSNLSGDMPPWLDYLPQDMLQFFQAGIGAGMPATSLLYGTSNMCNTNSNGGWHE